MLPSRRGGVPAPAWEKTAWYPPPCAMMQAASRISWPAGLREFGGSRVPKPQSAKLHDIKSHAIPCEAISREEYLTRAGLKAESQAAAVREQFAVLGSRAAFEEVVRRMAVRLSQTLRVLL